MQPAPDLSQPILDPPDLGRPDSAIPDLTDAKPDLGPAPAVCPSGRGFTNPALLYGGALPMGIAIADLDGDGALDVALANEVAASVTVFLRRGGAYELSDTYPTPGGGNSGYLEGLLAADLDGDGSADLLAWGSRPPLLFFNRGAGRFGPATLLDPMANSATPMVAGDLDRDGRIDLVGVGHWSGSITVYRNQGKGVFGKPQTYAIGQNPGGGALGDLDGDGDLDLAVSSYEMGGRLSVLLNRGDGTFAPKVDYQAGFNPGRVAIADLDGDGRRDVAAVTSSGNPGSSILAFRNLGGGVLAAPVEQAVTGAPSALALGDLDGDGRSDAVIANWGGEDLTVLRAGANGAFGAPIYYRTLGFGTAVAVADLDGDGHLDVAAPAYSDSGVDILLNRGNGELERPLPFLEGAMSRSLAARDFNEDGILDVAVGHDAAVSVLAGQKGQGLGAAVEYPVGADVYRVLAADFDGDGHSDLGVLTSASFGVLLGRGDGRFQPVVTRAIDPYPIDFALGDFDADGHADVALVGQSPARVTLMLGDGRGGLGPPDTKQVKQTPQAIAAGDWDGDGRVDLAVVYGGTLSLWRSMPGGGFQVAPDLTPGATLNDVSAGDLDGDGHLDLFLAGRAKSTYVLLHLRNRGDGTFAAPESYSDWHGQGRVALGDLDGDGLTDVAYPAGRGVHVRFRRGDRLADWVAFYGCVGDLAIGDFRGSGKLDMVGTCGDGHGLELLINRCH